MTGGKPCLPRPLWVDYRYPISRQPLIIRSFLGEEIGESSLLAGSEVQQERQALHLALHHGSCVGPVAGCVLVLGEKSRNGKYRKQ